MRVLLFLLLALYQSPLIVARINERTLRGLDIFKEMTASERDEFTRDLMRAVGDDPESHADKEKLLKSINAEKLRNSPDGAVSTLKQMLLI
mmetsp:Transcript_37185/g.83768  ORF Transcript_37185/g.83768 Transcript_37185/m.83768 type:complete len:91 (+) Transcript_37185:71-343(+)